MKRLSASTKISAFCVTHYSVASLLDNFQALYTILVRVLYTYEYI